LKTLVQISLVVTVVIFDMVYHFTCGCLQAFWGLEVQRKRGFYSLFCGANFDKGASLFVSVQRGPQSLNTAFHSSTGARMLPGLPDSHTAAHRPKRRQIGGAFDFPFLRFVTLSSL